MRKLFLLIPALVLAIVTNAAVINITPTSPHSANNLIAALQGAADGDVIILADGTYSENNNYIDFNKSVIVQAAEGAHPIVEVECYIKIQNNKDVTIKGIKFDGSKQDGTGINTSSYAHFIRVYSAGTIDVEDCEFYGSANKVFEVESSSSVANLIVKNCYFHNNSNTCIYIENTTASNMTVTNSTFANIDATAVSAGIIDTKTAAGTVVVDHCTFYDCKAKNTDYGVIGHNGSFTSDFTVSNSIFAWGTMYDKRATYLPSGTTVTNCLTCNTNKDTDKWGHHSGPTFINCTLQDPLFTDAANGDYSFAGNWVTMNLSPARGAATDGSDLGDPRWYSAEVLPSTDFAPSHVFLGAKAQLNGGFALNGDSYIQSDGTTTDGLAVWKIQAERKCFVDVTLNIASANTSGHRYEVALYDANKALVGAALVEPSNSWSAGDKAFGSFEIPAAGNYTVKLTNDCDYSSTIIEGVTFTYVGGAVQAMPGTTNIADAWFSAEGSRADGKIDFPDGSIQGGWVKWNVSFADAANYNVTVNIENENGHNYTVALYRSETDENPIIVTEGGQKSTLATLDLGIMEVPAGDYILKVTNATQWSDAKLISVNFAYAGGAAINLSKNTPASLLANADAILSDDWSIEGGKITHAESKATTGWAKWNVNSADYGNYNVTVNIASDNGHLVRVEIFEDETAAPIYTLDETSSTKWNTGDQAIDLGNIVLDAREYVVKVSNTLPSSHVEIASIVITYQNGAKQNIPGSLTLTDALLSTKAYVESDMLYFAPHDCGTIPDEWAKWNLYVAGANVYQFTINVTSPNGQKYQILIEDNNGNEVYNLVQTSSLGSGDKSFTTGMIYMGSGNYTLEMRNVYPYSDGHLVSISAAAVDNVLNIEENATDNDVIHNNYRNGPHTIHLIRTMVPDMYNTICLPFDVNSTQLKAVFGSDVELLQMNGATMNGNTLDLSFEAVTSIYRGTPYLIKTTKTITNPVFTEVEIKAEEGDATAGTAADFIGNFIAGEVPAGDQNLFLGRDDMLYFSQTATPIKGMRAYFHVKVPGAANNVKAARIVKGAQVVTEINLVGAESNTVKMIENGQLVIIRDGVRYNVMGAKIQ